jgi:DNA polymerase-3 subunit epsilon
MSSSIYQEREQGKEIDYRRQPLVFIDLEMTGLDPEMHKIIEIACLVVDPQTLRVKREYYAKVQPQHLETADPKALEMAGFNQEVWGKEAKPIREVLEELNELAPGGIFAGWNIASDMSFLESAVRKEGILLKYDYHRLDIASVVYDRLFGDKRLKEIKLTATCEVLGIPRGKKHTAMADTLATFKVYKALVKRKKA